MSCKQGLYVEIVTLASSRILLRLKAVAGPSTSAEEPLRNSTRLVCRPHVASGAKYRYVHYRSLSHKRRHEPLPNHLCYYGMQDTSSFPTCQHLRPLGAHRVASGYLDSAF
jgi:hypothetical protein